MPRSLHLFLVCLLTQTIRSSMPNFIVDPGNIIRSGVNDPPGVAFVLTGVGKSSFKTSILTLPCNPIDAFFLLDVILDCPSPVWAVVGADNKTKQGSDGCHHPSHLSPPQLYRTMNQSSLHTSRSQSTRLKVGAWRTPQTPNACT